MAALRAAHALPLRRRRRHRPFRRLDARVPSAQEAAADAAAVVVVTCGVARAVGGRRGGRLAVAATVAQRIGEEAKLRGGQFGREVARRVAASVRQVDARAVSDQLERARVAREGGARAHVQRRAAGAAVVRVRRGAVREKQRKRDETSCDGGGEQRRESAQLVARESVDVTEGDARGRRLLDGPAALPPPPGPVEWRRRRRDGRAARHHEPVGVPAGRRTAVHRDANVPLPLAPHRLGAAATLRLTWPRPRWPRTRRPRPRLVGVDAAVQQQGQHGSGVV